MTRSERERASNQSGCDTEGHYRFLFLLVFCTYFTATAAAKEYLAADMVGCFPNSRFETVVPPIFGLLGPSPFESMDMFPCAAPSRVCDSVWISCCVILIYSVSIPIPYPLYAHSLPLPVAMIPVYFCGLILSLFHSNPFRVGLPSDTIYFCQFHGDETTRGMFMRRCNAPRFPVDNLVAR